jgi:acyl-CoA thioester hydrolase
MNHHELLSGFPVIVEVPVAWGDMDAFGHVNNTMFFRYFETARIAFLDRIGFRGENGIGPILASTQCRFRRPLAFPDTVLVGARVSETTDDRFTHEYRLDYGAKTRCKIPQDVRARMEDL